MQTITICDISDSTAKKLCEILSKFGLHAKWQESDCADKRGAYYEIFINDAPIADEEINDYYS